MYEGHTVGVVVPAYNEAGFVGDVVETLPAFVDRAYVVDDRSTDDTWAEIERAAAAVNERTSDEPGQRLPAESGQRLPAEPGQRLHAESGQRLHAGHSPEHAGGPEHADAPERPGGSEHPDGRLAHADGGRAFDPRVVSIRHERNRGVGGAIKTGYRRAREDGLDVVAVMNGDGQMDPGILDRIIEPVVDGRAEYAKGDRLTRPDHRNGMPAWRLFGNEVLTFLTRCVSGYWRMSDPQNGYTAIAGRALDGIDLDRLYDGYGFCNDLLVHCNVHGLRVEDVPMAARYGDERSHIRYSRFVPSLSWLLLRRAVWRYARKYVVADFHPLVCLLALGVVGGGVGLLSVGWSVATVGAASAETLLSLVVVLLGVAFVALAMRYDRLAAEALESGVAGRTGGDRP